MTIIAAADGSALGNPGPAGWAWYVDESCWAAGGWETSTNNRGELTAVLELLRATAHTGQDLLIQADSQYVINSLTKWRHGWKRRGWRKADGKPVLNDDLIKELDAALIGREVRFEWVRGHVGHPLNEAADARARAAATAFQRGTAVPAGPGWTRGGGAGAVPAGGSDGDARQRQADDAREGKHGDAPGNGASATGSGAGRHGSSAGSGSGRLDAGVASDTLF